MTQRTVTRRQRLIGMGFVLAFILSTATIIYTGLNVRAPGSHRADQDAGDTAAADMPQNPPAEQADQVVPETEDAADLP